MKLSHLSVTIATSIATMSVAYAGGLERSDQSVAPLFEQGNYAEVYTAYIDPNMKATDIAKGNNDGMLEPYTITGASVKQDISDVTSIASFYSQPWGVSTKYPDTSKVFSNTSGQTEAQLASDAVGIAVKQKFSDNFSLYGGVDYHKVSGFVNIADPATGLYYKLGYKPDSAFVPMLGMAYEKPEMALRASATYRAPAHLKLLDTEVFNGATPIAGAMDISMPQSVNLDFQTGLSKKHQLLGKASARWVDWSNFEVAPTAWKAKTGKALASYEDDQYSVSLGLAKRFTPQFAGEVSVSYDHADNKKPLIALGPNGSTTGVGVGVQYDVNKNISLSGGAQYLMTKGGKVKNGNTEILDVKDSNGYAVGVKAAYKF